MDNLNYKEPTVSYYVHEGMLARNERTIKRLIIALVVAFVLIFASNALWLWAWSQYDYESTDTSQFVDVNAKEGIANYIGNDGDITNGADKSLNYKENKKKNAKER